MTPDKLPTDAARQGQRGRPVLVVLLASLAVLAVALVGLVTWQGATAPKDYASLSQDAARYTAVSPTTPPNPAPAPKPQ
jgi:flagellar basal body-associated protein FliL